MEEEIDIIELLKRVKEGKAPKKIKANGCIYSFDDIEREYYRIGLDRHIYNLCDENNVLDMFDTKIKILDKSIIEELHEEYDVSKLADTHKFIIDIGSKINEIIKHINNN